ncbi:hypothetical protein B0A55_00446 [Friedmanniomyces simplex]|uniref:Amidase domain-containing protein n=1 Tax=Friedmanniomyces simplex TaxID=329884 RepID=A0A4U0Y3C9_9PEZI|nr:hypothetical protein B0A55_00446 [Friedmanniomyces simplex]
MGSEVPSKEPWRLTAAEVLPLLRSNKLTVTDYVNSLLERIQARDPAIKAWAWIEPSLILQRAKELDGLPAEQRGPLHGLPIAVKDVILTKDMPTQFNSRLYESETSIAIDANCVITLRASGALIFGKTSTTEFASSKQGDWHQNLTSNARDPKRTPGGSSSGSGVAVADCQIPVGLGTQTGGSIVRPASFNGCYGFKPTHGAISREGLAQWSPLLDTLGFFGRSIDDLDVLADAFRLKDDEAVPPEPFNLKGAKIGFCKTHNWPKAGQGTIDAMTKAQDILRAHGAEVEDIELPNDFAHVLDWHATVLAGEGQTSFLGQYLLDKAKLHESISSYVDNTSQLTHRQLLDAYDNVARLRPVFDDLAKKYDVVLTPSVLDEAPLGLGDTGDMSMCSMWTILHVPAINLVGFQGANGMPIGLTAVGARYMDRHLLRVAKGFGEVFEREGGWEGGVLL